MEKRRRKMVGRLDTSNPKPKWHKTIYLDGDVIRETIHDGNFSPSPQEPTLVFVPAQFCGEIIGMKGDSHNPTRYVENGENCLATAFISKVEQQVSAVDIVLDDNQYQSLMKSRVVINDSTMSDYSQAFQSYLEQYKGTSQIVVAATELESALENGSHTIKVEYNGEESETMTFTVVTDYLYFEAMESNSTVSLMSTLETAPNLEYSTDGVTWQEWQHTTTTEDDVTTHTFDTLTLTAVGDRVYLRGDNPNGLNDFANEFLTCFQFSGKINAGGSVTSILDGDGVSMTALPDNAITALFGGGMMTQTPDTSLLTAPSFGNVTSIGDFACSLTYAMCTALQTPPSMLKITTIGDFGCGIDFSAMGGEGSGSMGMFYMCSSLSQPAGLTNVTYLGVAGLSGFYAGCHSLTSPDSIAITEIPNYGCSFMYAATAVSACMSMDNIISIGDFGCGFMYHDLDGESMNITSAADMNSVLTMGDGACSEMYLGCPISDPANMGNVSTFGKAAIDSMYGYEGGSVTLISDGQLTFDFPELPVTLGAGTPDEETLSTAQDVADYMTYVG